MLKIHTAYRYDFWEWRSITERILLLAVILWETDSARHVYVVFIILSVIAVNILKFK